MRLEGATQGSGVLVNRDGNRYTVLTAWHVVNTYRPGDEIDIYTIDGLSHQIEPNSIRKLGNVDLAVLAFTSERNYQLAPLGKIENIRAGHFIYVSGYPLASSSVPSRIWRFVKGDIVANSSLKIPNGYQVLYTNPTLPGMSGGTVLNAFGQLVAIHANAEKADKISEHMGKSIATGINQAVPITYFNHYFKGEPQEAGLSGVSRFDDSLVLLRAAVDSGASPSKIIALSNKVLEASQSPDAYF